MPPFVEACARTGPSRGVRRGKPARLRCGSGHRGRRRAADRRSPSGRAAPLRVVVRGRPGWVAPDGSARPGRDGTRRGFGGRRTTSACDAEVVVYVTAEVVEPEDIDAIGRRPTPGAGGAEQGRWPAPFPAGPGTGRWRRRGAQHAVSALARGADGADDRSACRWPRGRPRRRCGRRCGCWRPIRVVRPASTVRSPGSLTANNCGAHRRAAAPAGHARPVRHRARHRRRPTGQDAGAGPGPAAPDERRRRRPDQLAAVGAEVRYQRVLDAVAELEALAVSDEIGERQWVPVPRRHRRRPHGGGRRPGRGGRSGRRSRRSGPRAAHTCHGRCTGGATAADR